KLMKMDKRLKIVRDLITSETKPKWLIITILTVLPADLIPLVQLDGGRLATYDLYDVYRRVINRIIRLLKSLESNAPEIMLRNEKSMLPEAV
ncbi:hypothetical protein, partial [Streptobacillus felis]|uniref:hypothetical protein n=1 Tax=Streptobacillus felis TaxID=1384509 RepID=UPI000A42F1B6